VVHRWEKHDDVIRCGVLQKPSFLVESISDQRVSSLTAVKEDMEPASLVASVAPFRNVDPGVFHDGIMPCPSFDLLVRAISLPTFIAMTTRFDSTWYNVTEHISNLVRITVEWLDTGSQDAHVMRVRFDVSWVDMAPRIRVHLNTATEPLEELIGGIDRSSWVNRVKSILLQEDSLSLEVRATGHICTAGTPCPELQVGAVGVWLCKY